jgi:hypothetical protein
MAACCARSHAFDMTQPSHCHTWHSCLSMCVASNGLKQPAQADQIVSRHHCLLSRHNLKRRAAYTQTRMWSMRTVLNHRLGKYRCRHCTVGLCWHERRISHAGQYAHTLAWLYELQAETNYRPSHRSACCHGQQKDGKESACKHQGQVSTIPRSGQHSSCFKPTSTAPSG